MKLENTGKTRILFNIKLRLMNRNQNFLACVTGPTGSGKTYATLTIAESLAELTGVSFPKDASNVVFNSSEFLALINSKPPKGTCIVFDEAGVGYNNREWQSVGNKLMNYLMQTFRHRNYCVIFNMPDFNFVDLAARKLFHARFETLLIDYKNKQVFLKPFFLSVNQATGKQYNKYFRTRGNGFSLTYGKIMQLRCNMPSKELVEAYERKKSEYTTKLNEEIEKELGNLKKDEKNITAIQAQVLFGKKLGMSDNDIASKLGKSQAQIYTIKRLLTERGFLLPS